MAFDLVQPASLGAAIGLLARSGTSAYPIAGGTDLMLDVRIGRIAPSLVVPIGRLPELRQVERLDSGLVRIGAGLTLREIANSAAIQAAAPLLSFVCSQTRSPQVRTLATLGGVLASGSPHTEPSIALLVHDARVAVVGPAGERGVPLADFLAAGANRLSLGELIVGVDVVPAGAEALWGYYPLRRRGAIEPPLIAAAAQLAVEAGRVRSASVALGIGTPWAVRLPAVEAALLGQTANPISARSASARAGEGEFRGGIRASADYRQHVAPIVVARAIERALAAAPETARDGRAGPATGAAS